MSGSPVIDLKNFKVRGVVSGGIEETEIIKSMHT